MREEGSVSITTCTTRTDSTLEPTPLFGFPRRLGACPNDSAAYSAFGAQFLGVHWSD